MRIEGSIIKREIVRLKMTIMKRKILRIEDKRRRIIFDEDENTK